MPRIRLKHVDMYYEEAGGGHAVLLIPGLGAPGRSWGGQTPALARHFRVIAVDNRGAGQSSAPSGPWRMADLAADAVDLMDALDIERAHVLGASMGAFAALELGAAHPSRVGRMVLSNACLRLSPAVRRRVMLWERLRTDGVADEVCLEEQMLWTLPDAVFENRSLVAQMIHMALQNRRMQDPEGHRRQLEACLAYDGAAAASGIAAHTLVVTTRDDRMITAADSQALARRLTRGRFACLPTGGHAPHILDPGGFNGVVGEFLRGAEG